MARSFEASRRALAKHGATVEKFIGDAVMAVFGLPVRHEDDALRAVRGALDMRVGLTTLAESLEREHAIHLDVGIGVNTGEVVSGHASMGPRFVTGDAVNVAARLEQAASSREILMGQLTYALVRDFADVRDRAAYAQGQIAASACLPTPGRQVGRACAPAERWSDGRARSGDDAPLRRVRGRGGRSGLSADGHPHR